ncbi:MAG: citryl-CoA lyase [Gammaproteobacteria bacterium]|nr:citryl-CoA lyase [Gammaproteobacteria bacterium]
MAREVEGDTPPKEKIRTTIWAETPEVDNPFAARVCHCHGYDVFGELITKASLPEYLYLLFRGERPTPEQARAVEILGVAFANPGVRDLSVRGAMNAGVADATSAAYLVAALSVGAGQNGGAHEVARCVELWNQNGRGLDLWRASLTAEPAEDAAPDIWLEPEHPPGFDPHGVSCALPVLQLLDALADTGLENSRWLREQRTALESFADHPLYLPGVAAAALADLGFGPEQAELLFLILRLPGAAVHALEQRGLGPNRYPFFARGLKLTDDPGPISDDLGIVV